MNIRRWLFAAGLCLLAPSPIRAECVLPGLWLVENQFAELVFSGSVTRIDPAGKGTRVAFDVDRVWKGSAPRHFDLFVGNDYAMPTFEVGRGYVVFATPMNDRSREYVGLTDKDPIVLRPVDCGALDHKFAEESGLIRELGVSQPPK